MGIEDILQQNAAAAATVTGNPHPAAVQPAPVVAPVVAPVPAPVVAAPVSTTPAAITLTPEQWASYTASLTRLDQLEAVNATRESEARQAAIDSARAKGEIKQAFDLTREQARIELEAERSKLKAVEDRSKRYALDGELARALASHPLVPGGAEQLTQLLRDEFTVEGRGETIVVQSKDMRSVAQYVDAILAAKFPHFLRAQNPQGGTAQAGTTQSTPTAPAIATQPVGPANMSEAVEMFYNGQKPAGNDPRKTGGGTVGDDGKIIPRAAAGFGLRRQA